MEIQVFPLGMATLSKAIHYLHEFPNVFTHLELICTRLPFILLFTDSEIPSITKHSCLPMNNALIVKAVCPEKPGFFAPNEANDFRYAGKTGRTAMALTPTAPSQHPFYIERATEVFSDRRDER